MDYEANGGGYAAIRRPDPTIEAAIWAALGEATSVVNVGAGAGSYEPTDRVVIPVEPSASQRAERPSILAPALDGVAGDLPLENDSVDAAMTTISVHQWPDLEAGLAEMRRVARGPVVVLTFDPAHLATFWFAEVGPAMWAHERGRMPSIDRIVAGLGGSARVETVPVPLACTDGFMTAFYRRPERILDPAVRRAQSAWSFVDDEEERSICDTLAASLASGDWDARSGHLRTQPTYDGSLRLIVAEP